MILDVSKYQGVINWQTVAAANIIERVILRSTVRSGGLDTYFMENYKGIKENLHFLDSIDVYKFSYARTCSDAFNECEATLKALNSAEVLNEIGYLWLDLEGWGGRDYTRSETFDVTLGYLACCAMYGVELGIYCNWNYVHNILDKRLAFLPVWLARYNTKTGDYSPFDCVMWQYTSKGRITGINADVDISRYLTSWR